MKTVYVLTLLTLSDEVKYLGKDSFLTKNIWFAEKYSTKKEAVKAAGKLETKLTITPVRDYGTGCYML